MSVSLGFSHRLCPPPAANRFSWPAICDTKRAVGMQSVKTTSRQVKLSDFVPIVGNGAIVPDYVVRCQ